MTWWARYLKRRSNNFEAKWLPKLPSAKKSQFGELEAAANLQAAAAKAAEEAGDSQSL